MMQPQRNELKTGKRPVQQQIRSFKNGETLFTEGSAGRELFIIQDGKVGVYKDGQDGRIELAQIEQGGLIGEMSLLDTLPRSATVIALGNVKTLVIGYTQFQSVMQSIPVWLQSIIKIVVSRLRDANRRVDQSILRDKERGIVALVKLLLPVCKVEIAAKMLLPYDTVVSEACFISRLRKKEVTELLTQLEKRTIITRIAHDDKQYIHLSDNDAFNLYEEYLILRSQKKTFRELAVPQDAIGLLSNIAYIAQKVGHDTEDGTVLSKQALIDDLNQKDASQLDKHLTDLARRSLITMAPTEGGTAIIFKKQTLARIKKIQEWMPRFSMELP
jgi:CRP/FNR family transcriptional regulator, cyclic AMP receptor protein